MRIFNTIILIALILLLSGEVMAGGLSVSGVGTRALSMAGAFRGVADDWSAMYYNPAGLANLYQNEIALGIDFYDNRPEFTPEVTVNGYHFGYYDGENRYPHDRVLYAPYAAAVFLIPVFENVAAGFGVFQPYDLNTEWDVFRLSPTYNPYIEDTFYLPVTEPLVEFPSYPHRMDIDVIDFHPTVAAELVEDKLSVGAGLSIRKGSYHRNEVMLIPNELPEEYSFRPYEHFVQITELNAVGWGLGFNAGFLFKYNDELSIGASYQSKTTIDLSGDAFATLYAPGNRHIVDYADTSSVAHELFQGDTYHTGYDAKADWTLPSEFGVGLAYRFSEKFMAAVDFSYTLWSEYDDIIINEKNPRGLTEYEFINGLLVPGDFINRWDDAYRISVGVEGSPNPKYRLRGGYSFDQSPIPDDNASMQFITPANRHYLTGGASYFYKRMEFYGAVELIITPEATVTDLVDLNNDGIWDNQPGIYKDFSVVTSFGFTVRF
jgi:long-chain fatty acid transport protein